MADVTIQGVASFKVWHNDVLVAQSCQFESTSFNKIISRVSGYYRDLIVAACSLGKNKNQSHLVGTIWVTGVQKLILKGIFQVPEGYITMNVAYFVKVNGIIDRTAANADYLVKTNVSICE